MISNEQLAALDALAKEATPGPWIAGGPSFGANRPAYYDDVLIDFDGDTDELHECDSICVAPHGLEEDSSQNMLYIAAANPTVIRALIAELLELRRNKSNTTGEFHYDGY